VLSEVDWRFDHENMGALFSDYLHSLVNKSQVCKLRMKKELPVCLKKDCISNAL
jgi:hypothetical protein